MAFMQRKPAATLEKPGTRKAKTACFKLINGVAIESGPAVPKPPRTLLSKTARNPSTARTLVASGNQGAQWVVNCNQVLKFQAYFKEAVNESAMENYRTRLVNFMYYLADDKIEITEVKTENSGIPQGQFLKKGKTKKMDGAFVQKDDLVVGSTIELHGRTFYIINCDHFTRQHFQEAGTPQPADQPQPADVYNTSRALMKERDTGADQTIARGKKQNPLKKFMEASLGNASPRMRVGTQSDNLSRFLENDRKVLRFFAMWDDSDTLYGQIHKYTINFFLADGTMEVLEINKPNEGRDHFPCFLKRGKVERNRSTTIDGAGVNGVEDEDDHGSIFLTAGDLVVGQHVIIHGRRFLIHDADESTYAVLQSASGIDYRQHKVDVDPVPEPAPEIALPPYNGFGDVRDSEENCKKLVPKPPKTDFHKAMNNAANVLRYSARMVAKNDLDVNKDRRFIVRYYLENDTMDVFEPPVRNSGILGGQFLKRCAAENPATNARYKPEDIVTGSTLIFSAQPFHIDGCDDYTLNYMESQQ